MVQGFWNLLTCRRFSKRPKGLRFNNRGISKSNLNVILEKMMVVPYNFWKVGSFEFIFDAWVYFMTSYRKKVCFLKRRKFICEDHAFFFFSFGDLFVSITFFWFFYNCSHKCYTCTWGNSSANRSKQLAYCRQRRIKI